MIFKDEAEKNEKSKDTVVKYVLYLIIIFFFLKIGFYFMDGWILLPAGQGLELGSSTGSSARLMRQSSQWKYLRYNIIHTLFRVNYFTLLLCCKCPAYKM